ncbi:hypothetical protein [Brevundimonas sp. FT23028]|uniref:hypothetical protein n=1 Tax=Brevundimonas sp. FT23028 TaxID=3393748 RepID=UPI003B58844B
MSISLVSSLLSGIAGLTGTDPTRQNSPSAPDSAPTAVRSEVEEIRQKGLTEWAREQKMEALREKLRSEILSGKGLTEQGVAALPEDQGASIEDEIARLVRQKLEETLQQQMQDAVRSGKTQAVLLDIMV